MPPLKRIKQEQFCHALLDSSSQTEAYQKVYKANYDTARADAAISLAKPSIRNRVLELLEQRKAGLKRVSEKLKEHLESKKETISLETCKTILKVAGAFDDEQGNSVQNIQINIVTSDSVST